MLRQTLKTEAINQLVDTCFSKYPDGLVTNVQKGHVPAQSQSVARYVAKYVVSPPIAVRRIDRYDGAAGHLPLPLPPHRPDGVRNRPGQHVYWPDGATVVASHIAASMWRSQLACGERGINDCCTSLLRQDLAT